MKKYSWTPNQMIELASIINNIDQESLTIHANPTYLSDKTQWIINLM